MHCYRTLDQAHLNGKRVLLRAGFDVSLEDGKVLDPSRIAAIVPTMRSILDAGAALVVMAHQGRPKGTGFEQEFSQIPLVPVLQQFLHVPILFAPACTGDETLTLVQTLRPGQVLLLENLRFHAGEKKNDPVFAQNLAKLADVYVNDAFTNIHREDASMIGVPALLPGYMGLRLAEEVKNLSSVMHDPRRPLTVIIGGAKMETKIPVIASFLAIANDILIGGAVANTFLAARGFDVGRSKHEPEFFSRAQEFMLEGEKEGKGDIHIPCDALVADAPRDDAPHRNLPLGDIGGNLSIFDIGKATFKRYGSVIERSGMVVWNGPMGLCEVQGFADGTRYIAQAIAAVTRSKGCVSIIGGGDTIDFHARYGLSLDAYSFVSTGGGAMLEFLSGKPLRALEVLRDR